jgi:hypothetical protein
VVELPPFSLFNRGVINMTKKIEKIDKIVCDASICELAIINADDRTSIGEFKIKHTEDDTGDPEKLQWMF